MAQAIPSEFVSDGTIQPYPLPRHADISHRGDNIHNMGFALQEYRGAHFRGHILCFDRLSNDSAGTRVSISRPAAIAVAKLLFCSVRVIYP